MRRSPLLRRALAVGSTAAALTLMTPTPAFAFEREQPEMYSAASAAAAVSTLRFPAGADTVILTTEGFADALTGAALAAKIGAPLLFAGLESATADELGRLGPSQLVVVGGTGAVADEDVDNAVFWSGTNPTVTRVAGLDRYATSAAVSERFEPGGIVYVATGENWPDAVAGSGAAGTDDAPILLVTKGAIPSATASALTRLQPSQINVLGGSGVISDATVDALAAYADVTRLSGDDRYGTSVAVAEHGFDGDAREVVLVPADVFHFALVAAPLAAERDAALLFAGYRCSRAITRSFTSTQPLRKVTLIGDGRWAHNPLADCNAGAPMPHHAGAPDVITESLDVWDCMNGRGDVHYRPEYRVLDFAPAGFVAGSAAELGGDQLIAADGWEIQYRLPPAGCWAAVVPADGTNGWIPDDTPFAGWPDVGEG